MPEYHSGIMNNTYHPHQVASPCTRAGHSIDLKSTQLCAAQVETCKTLGDKCYASVVVKLAMVKPRLGLQCPRVKS
jgi:hypothetical protein